MRKNKKPIGQQDLHQLHVVLCNDNIILSDMISKTLKNMNKEQDRIKIKEIELKPFTRVLLNYIKDYKTDVIIIDSVLKEQNSLQAIHKIKEIDKDIKIILMTTIFSKKIEGMFERGEIDDFVLIPYQDVYLYHAMERCFFSNTKENEFQENLDEPIFDFLE
ncbi:MAG: hypothetical protein RSC93_04255 [Erysipelotrichaceae bacterium]